jgi:hypothetical protein
MIILGKPLDGQFENEIGIFNEVMVCIYLYSMITLTDYNHKNSKREESSTFLAFIVLLSAGMNFLKFLVLLSKALCRKTYLLYLRKRAKANASKQSHEV